MTPEEIVGMIGNIGNRPDIRAVQERQVKEIKNLLNSKLAPVLNAIQAAIEPATPPAEPVEQEAPQSEELSEAELATMFNEKPKKKNKKAKLKKMTLEEIESWEKAQENSNDIYKVAARVKNAARMAVKANLTPQGEMVCNTFTHLVKGIYDLADTIADKETKAKLINFAKKQEEAPAGLIEALSAGVRAPS